MAWYVRPFSSWNRKTLDRSDSRLSESVCGCLALTLGAISRMRLGAIGRLAAELTPEKVESLSSKVSAAYLESQHWSTHSIPPSLYTNASCGSWVGADMMYCVCWLVICSRWLLRMSEMEKGINVRNDSKKTMISQVIFGVRLRIGRKEEKQLMQSYNTAWLSNVIRCMLRAQRQTQPTDPPTLHPLLHRIILSSWRSFRIAIRLLNKAKTERSFIEPRIGLTKTEDKINDDIHDDDSVSLLGQVPAVLWDYPSLTKTSLGSRVSHWSKDIPWQTWTLRARPSLPLEIHVKSSTNRSF